MSLMTAYECDRGIIPIVSRMMANGMPISVPALQALRPKLKSSQDQAFFACAEIAGRPFNPGSSDQVAAIIHGMHKVPVRYKTEGGKPSTKEAYLSVYAADYPKIDPLVKQIVEYRKYDQLISTFVDPIIAKAVDGWIHCQLKLTGTDTGRLSSSDPNMQNIPTRDVEGQWIRDCFVAPEGWMFVSNDLSQIELRCAAHISQDPELLKAYRTPGTDLHTATALAMFGRSDGIWRYIAKCFHPDTEVLTHTGWKQIVSLTVGEEVIQAHPGEDGKVEFSWTVPTEVFVKDNPTPELVHLTSEGINLRVTPDHRMLAWGGEGKGKKKSKYRVVTPEELPGTLRIANSGDLNTGMSNNPDTTLLKLAVAAEADGNYSGKVIRFGFYNKRKIKQIKELAGEGEYRLTEYKNGDLRPVTYVTLSIELSAEVRKLLTPEKCFPWWWLDLSPQRRRVVLAEVSKWDGGKYKRWTQTVYTSGKRQSRDVIQALASITGRKAKQHQASSTLRISDHGFTDARGIKVTKIPYRGKIACLSVPSTFVLVRDGGVPVVTGQTINFAILYGISAEGLYKGLVKEAPQTPWTIPQCQGFLDKYFRSHPGVVRYIDQTRSFLRRHGYVEDMFGGRRHIPKIYSASPRLQAEAEREGTNLPVQGSAARILKIQMLAVDQQMQTLGWYEKDLVRPLLQIHDDLVFLVREEIVDLAAGVIRGTMEGAFEMSVPILATTKIGKRWGSLKEEKEMES